MTIETINIGNTTNGGTGADPRTVSQKEAVKTYRQALLDITLQAPASVLWPEPPSI